MIEEVDFQFVGGLMKNSYINVTLSTMFSGAIIMLWMNARCYLGLSNCTYGDVEFTLEALLFEYGVFSFFALLLNSPIFVFVIIYYKTFYRKLAVLLFVALLAQPFMYFGYRYLRAGGNYDVDWLIFALLSFNGLITFVCVYFLKKGHLGSELK